MREIPLVNGRGVALVDDEDYERLADHRWYTSRGRYAYRVEKDSSRRKVYMHRDVLLPPAGTPIDHIDGNGLNNQRANLRTCTHRENCRNTRARRGAKRTSAFKGVGRTYDGRWRAFVVTAGRMRHLGRFETETDAAKAFDEAARCLHGQFARLNFPRDGERGALVEHESESA